MGEELGRNPEQESRHRLVELARVFFGDEEARFVESLDPLEEAVGYLYGRLLNEGEDPDTVLRDCDITQEEEE